jgi:outer membrane immunogenic protein
MTVAALAATAFAVPAMAQDATASSDTPFSGPRVEGLVGWDRVQNRGHDSGVAYGIGAGYDWQSGGMVFGAEVEAADSSTKRCAGARTPANPRICARSGRDLYVGGRVGTVLGDRTLLYAKAGYDNSRIKASFDDGTSKLHDGRNLDGVRLGAGAEYKLGRNTYVKAEYRYTNAEDHWSRQQVVGGVGFRF